MALAANGHIVREQCTDDRDKHGYVEIVEPNDRAYFKAELLDINPEIRQYYVRYERPRESSKSCSLGTPIVSVILCTLWFGMKANKPASDISFDSYVGEEEGLWVESSRVRLLPPLRSALVMICPSCKKLTKIYYWVIFVARPGTRAVSTTGKREGGSIVFRKR